MGNNNINPKLWAIAKKRAKFKMSLYTYVIVNIFLWDIWLFVKNDKPNEVINFPWPAWVSLSWGVAIALQYVDAYKLKGKSAIEKEYEKLKSEENKEIK